MKKLGTQYKPFQSILFASFPLLFSIAIGAVLLITSLSLFSYLFAGSLVAFGVWGSIEAFLWVRSIQLGAVANFGPTDNSAPTSSSSLSNSQHFGSFIDSVDEIKDRLSRKKKETAEVCPNDNDGRELPAQFYSPELKRWTSPNGYLAEFPNTSPSDIILDNSVIYTSMSEFISLEEKNILKRSSVSTIRIWGDQRGNHFLFDCEFLHLKQSENNSYTLYFSNGATIQVFDPWFVEEWMDRFRIVEASRIVCTLRQKDSTKAISFDYRFREKVRVSKTDFGYQMEGYDCTHSFALEIDVLPAQRSVANFI